MHTMNDTPKEGVGWGRGRQTSTAEENGGEMLNIVEGSLEKVGLQGWFERGCRLDVTDLTRKPVPPRWASKRAGPKDFVFVSGTLRILMSVEERS